MAEHILDEKRHATEGSLAQGFRIEAVDAVEVELNNRPDRGVDLLLGGDRRLRQLLGAHLLLGNQLGQAQGVVGSVFDEVHLAIPLCQAIRAASAAGPNWMLRPGAASNSARV